MAQLCCSIAPHCTLTRCPHQLSWHSTNPKLHQFRQKSVLLRALHNSSVSLYNKYGWDSENGMDVVWDVFSQWTMRLDLDVSSKELPILAWAAITPVVVSYLFGTPGTVAGLIDFVYAPIHASSVRTFSPDDVKIGRQLGEGSFGVVYEGFYGQANPGDKIKPVHIVLKKPKMQVNGAEEIHASEIHMNYRLQRTGCEACAEFLGTMNVSPSQARGKLSKGVWLVWKFQGDRSLDYYLKQKNFPENVTSIVLGRMKPTFSKEVKFRRNATIVRLIFRQILENLEELHKTGVVHRDVKPLNLILDQEAGKFKLVDLGACVDVRTGHNFVPNETVIDPTYAAPEQYIMPTTTPRLPPDPLCSLVSPLVWYLNTPDRFDLYSVGLILMQLTMRPLRQDTGLLAFNTELRRSGYNLNTWRANSRFRKDEFALLDADGGAGWELASCLLQLRRDRDYFIWPSLGNSRPSASAALNHPYVKDALSMSRLLQSEIESANVVLPDLGSFAQNFTSVGQSVLIENGDLFGKALQLKVIFNFPTLKSLEKNATKMDKTGIQSSPDIFNKLSKPYIRFFTIDKAETQLNSKAKEKPKKPNKGERNEQPETKQKPSEQVKADFGFTLVAKAIPMVVPSVLVFTAGWQILSALNSSFQASYELGKDLVSSCSISGLAFLTFFLVIKPWLEGQNMLSGKIVPPEMGESNGFQEPELSISSNLQTQASNVRPQAVIGTHLYLERFKPLDADRSELIEAVQKLELQMSSFEALILEEKEVSYKQLLKMEGLLQQSTSTGLVSSQEDTIVQV